MIQRLHFATLNVNRLRDNIKRNNLLVFLKTRKLDIIALQETNFDNSFYPSRFTFMGCKVSWNGGMTITSLITALLSKKRTYTRRSYYFSFANVLHLQISFHVDLCTTYDRYMFFDSNLPQLPPAVHHLT
jgi:exonuclease III